MLGRGLSWSKVGGVAVLLSFFPCVNVPDVKKPLLMITWDGIDLNCSQVICFVDLPFPFSGRSEFERLCFLQTLKIGRPRCLQKRTTSFRGLGIRGTAGILPTSLWDFGCRTEYWEKCSESLIRRSKNVTLIPRQFFDSREPYTYLRVSYVTSYHPCRWITPSSKSRTMTSGSCRSARGQAICGVLLRV